MDGGLGSGVRCEQYAALLEAALENAPDGVLVVDQDWRMIYFNRRFLEMWEIPTWVQAVRDDRRSIQTVLDKLEDPQGFMEKVEFLMEHPDLCSKDELRLKDGRLFDRYTSPLHDKEGGYIGRIWFFRDITDRVEAQRQRLRLEAEIRRLEKLESLRTFAASVTHHVNNLLFGILGNIELAQRALDHRVEETATFLNTAKEITARAAQFVDRMLFFMGNRAITAIKIELEPFISKLAHKVAQTLPPGVRMEVLPGEPATVQGDPSLLSAAVEAVCHNAIEAVGDGGEVRISWRPSRPPTILYRAKAVAEGRGHLQEGRFVCIEVADNGCGMEKEVRERAFDPFFSTKEFGRGLGLAQVLGIVHAHGGEMDLVSEPGKGTTVSIFLPVSRRTPS